MTAGFSCGKANGVSDFAPILQMKFLKLKTKNFLVKRLVLAVLFVAATSVALADWPQFRGPLGSGHIPGGQALPGDWSETKNIEWKVALPGRAWSSPVVFADKIWLTTADEKGNKLSGLCVDANTGKIIFEKQLFMLFLDHVLNLLLWFCPLD